MTNKQYKVIDFEKRGNVVRFYLGNIDDNDYWGDDWDDRPYEHNAGTVYGASEYVEYGFPLTVAVNEPADDWHYNGNSPYSKEDFKNQKAPCIILTKLQEDRYWDEPCYSIELGNKESGKIYFNDTLSDLYNITKEFNGISTGYKF